MPLIEISNLLPNKSDLVIRNKFKDDYKKNILKIIKLIKNNLLFR